MKKNQRHCRCADCKRQKRKGNILGSHLLRYLGSAAHYVFAYVPYHRWQKGRRPDDTTNTTVD